MTSGTKVLYLMKMGLVKTYVGGGGEVGHQFLRPWKGVSRSIFSYPVGHRLNQDLVHIFCRS